MRCFVHRLKPEKLEKELKQFSESAKKRKGEKINLKEFAEYLSVPVTEKLEDLFALFDEVSTFLIFKNVFFLINRASLLVGNLNL